MYPLLIRNKWNSLAINHLADSYYQEWTYEDRKLLEYTCQAGFLFSVVVVQWMTAIQVRSRKYSMVQKPLNNHVLNFALIFETVLALLIIYVPGNSEVEIQEKIFYWNTKNISLQGLQLAPMYSPIWWLPGLAFSIVLVSYEELRKAIARKHPGAWVDKETRY